MQHSSLKTMQSFSWAALIRAINHFLIMGHVRFYGRFLFGGFQFSFLTLLKRNNGTVNSIKRISQCSRLTKEWL